MARVRMPGLLDGELQEVARLRVRAGQYQLSADDVSQATLTIPEDGPAVGLRDWVSLYDVDGLTGIYRVTNIAQTVKRQIQLTLLHGIDILADSYWAEEREYTGNVRGYLEALLQQQTALIDGTAPWVLGDCEDTETTLNVKISYGRLSELIREAVPEGGGYQLEYDQTVWPWRVHLRAKPTAAAAEFRVARNITSATVTYNDADLCTRLILSNTSGGESRVRVYNAGAIAQAEWGIVTKTASIDTSDTLTSESWPEAEAWVAQFFALHAAPSVQIQIEGRELYRLTGDRWDRASLGRVCRVSLPEYGHTFEERVVSLTYPDPWGDPDRVVVSLANALPQFSEQVKLIEKTARSASRAAGGAARKADQAEEKADEVIYRTDFTKTDRGIGMLAEAIGVKIDPTTGLPVYDEETGSYAFDGVNGATLAGRLSVEAAKIISEVTVARGDQATLGSRITQTANAISAEVTRAQGAESGLSSALQLKADSATLISAINNASGTIAYGKVQVQPGNVLIEAINNGDGTVTISADKVNINGDTVISWLTSRSVDVATLQASSSLVCTGDTTINNVEVTGTLTIPSSGQASYQITADNLVKSLAITPPASGSSDYTLTWTTADGQPHTLTFSRAASISTVSGSWSGSTYTVAADATASGAPLPKSVTIDAILAGGGTSDFSAQIRDTSSGPSPVIIDSDAAHGYLAKSGNSVVVYTSRSGSTYSGPVASLSFQPEITSAVNTALANVTVSGTWSGGKITIANSANSNTIVDYLRAGTATWNGTTVTVPVQHSTTPDNTSSFADTGQSVSVNVSGKLYNPGTITPTSSAQTISVPSGYIGFAGPLNIAAASGGGASVSSVGLYFDNEGMEDVTTPFSVDNDYTVYPIAKMSDGTRRVGSAVRLTTTTISLYDLGTITPTSSQQTFNVPTGYAGFAGPIRVAAASGGGGTVSYSTSSVSNSSVPGSADIVFIADRRHSVRIDIKQNGSTVKTLYVGPPLT